MIRSAFAIILFLLPVLSDGGQRQLLLKRNLQEEWKVYTGSEYVPAKQSDGSHTIYFLLQPRLYKGDYLHVESNSPFSIFVNRGFLLQGQGVVRISMDSLANGVEPVLIAVNQKVEITKQTLLTRIFTEIRTDVQAGQTSWLRSTTYFKDFVITAILFLFIFLILMIQLNPRLSSDYFSVNKIFSLRESDDDQYYLRITSANILFYVFTSLVIALFFLMVAEFTGSGFEAIDISASTFGGTLLVWLKLSLLILLFLFFKTVVVYVASSLFDIRESAGYHYFNFTRVLLVVATALTLILGGYFILNGVEKGVYSFLFDTLGWVIGIWMIILFFKLSYRVRFSPIHLFSYICATEILPFLIIVKILYK